MHRPGDCIIIFLIEPRLATRGEVVDTNAKHRRAAQHAGRCCWGRMEGMALFVHTGAALLIPELVLFNTLVKNLRDGPRANEPLTLFYFLLWLKPG